MDSLLYKKVYEIIINKPGFIMIKKPNFKIIDEIKKKRLKI